MKTVFTMMKQLKVLLLVLLVAIAAVSNTASAQAVIPPAAFPGYFYLYEGGLVSTRPGDIVTPCTSDCGTIIPLGGTSQKSGVTGAMDVAGKKIYEPAYRLNFISMIDMVTGHTSVVAGNQVAGPGSADGGPGGALSAVLGNPVDLVIDPINSDVLYFIEEGGTSNLGRVRRLTLSTKTVVTIFTLPASTGVSIAIKPDGKTIYASFVISTGSAIYTIDSASNIATIFASQNPSTAPVSNGIVGVNGSGIGQPYGMAVDASGTYLYATDFSFNSFYKINLASKATSVLVSASTPSGGNPGVDGAGTGGTAPFGTLYGPRKFYLDARGNAYIGDYTGGGIRFYNAASNSLITLAGTTISGIGWQNSNYGFNGPARKAKIYQPAPIGIEPSTGSLFFAFGAPNGSNFLTGTISGVGSINGACTAGSVAPVVTASSISNSCPAATADLTPLQQGTPPAGSAFQWHSGTPGTSANIVANPAAVGTGVYYLTYYDAVSGCFSPTSAGSVTVTTNNCGIGTIDCGKTQLSTAAVAGAPGQKDLLVTINVTAAGCFGPISVSGSGITLAGLSSVCATATGIQQFHIPVNYDGSALGTMNFTIGQAGSCSADLTKPSKKGILDLWTLDCVPTVGPSLK